jgi:hypothetical protein
MTDEQRDALIAALEAWEARYQSERASLTLKEIHDLRAVLARIVEAVERDATGPSTMPVTPPQNA